MPYTVPDRATGERLIRENHCSICDGRLYIYTDGKYGGQLTIACNLGHSSITKESWKPAPEGNLLERSLKLAEQKGIDTVALTNQGIPLTGVINYEQSRAIIDTVWKDAPEIQKYKAATVCQDLGLHPLLNHVFLVKYDRYKLVNGTRTKQGEDWVVVLGIGATRLMMSRLGSFSYFDDTPRIMSDDEQMKIFGRIDEKNIVAITRLRTRDKLEASGYGKYPRTGGYLMGEDKGNTRENMAFIRSERNAFGRLFPDQATKMPKDVEVMDEAHITGVVEVEDGEGNFVEVKTDEPVTLEEAEELGAKGFEDISEPTEQEVVEAEFIDESPITPEMMVELDEFLKAANMSYGDLGRWMKKDKEWKLVSQVKDLKVWQFNEIKTAFVKGE